jgi:hypothetical protein
MKKLLVLFVLISQFAYSQSRYDFVFRVMISSGKNFVRKDNNWLPLKTGMKLQLSDEIKVETNSFLGLAHVSGKTTEVKKAGTYQVSRLASVVNTPAASVARKYADFLMAQLTEPRSKTLNERMNITAAVERGEKGAITVLLSPTEVCHLMQNQYRISWYALPGTRNYTVKVMDFYDKILLRTAVSDTNFVLDLRRPELRSENLFKIMVFSKDNVTLKSGEYALQRIDEAEFKTIKAELADLQTDADTSSLQHIMLASYFEEKKFFLNAAQNFASAIRREPEVTEYREMYADFLRRNAMTKDKPGK